MFKLLGPLTVEVPNQHIDVRAAKQRAILAVLLLRPDQVVTIDRLMAELWGEDPPATAKASLQTYVYRLRRTLSPLSAHGVTLATRESGYMLTVPEGAVDVPEFERLVSEGAAALAGGTPETAAVLLRDALAMWRGPLMANTDGESVRQERVRLEEVRVHAHELCLDAELRLGLQRQAVLELQRLVRAWPFRESLWAMLIRALDSCGRRAEALAAYREVYSLLGEELGIEPSGELQRLHQDILRGDRPSGPATRERPDVEPIGT